VVVHALAASVTKSAHLSVNEHRPLARHQHEAPPMQRHKGWLAGGKRSRKGQLSSGISTGWLTKYFGSAFGLPLAQRVSTLARS